MSTKQKSISSEATGADQEDAVTLGQYAYGQIRSDILKGHFPAGSPLRLQALKDRYGLSFSPLREALNRLQSERLVDSVAARGFRVTEVSLEEMWDAIETRILVDCEGLRRSIDRGDDDWEGRLIGAFHALAKCIERSLVRHQDPTEDEVAELEDRHRTFHLTLLSASGSQWMQNISAQLYDHTQRYRWPYFVASAANSSLKRYFLDENRKIVELSLARSTDEAAKMFAASIHRTGELIETLSKDDIPRHREG